ncbi:MAG TPA: ATP-binding protein [Actinocrinis sp.]|nr:ATP-binding protein [Actinocrinis sp.]
MAISRTVSVSAGSGGGAQPSGLVHAAMVEHLGEDAQNLPVATGTWQPHDHVNVQAAIDVWTERHPGAGRLLGLTGFRHRMFGLADLCTPGLDTGMAVGAAARVELASGPGGEVRGCVQCGVYLITDGDARTAVLVRGSDDRGPQQDIVVEIASTAPGEARRLLAELRALAIEHNVYRGRVVSFGGEVFGPFGRGALLSFHPRPTLEREQLVLPEGLLEGVERQIIGVARHRELLLAHGQHLKRGVLLYGPPGVGKTHTIRYLMSRLPQTTVLMLSSTFLPLIRQACSVARTLQPSLLIVEDVDLIAEERGPRLEASPLLFQLLNEMDGLGEDVDVTFVLTTNRVDVLEPALAARPGRIDHAVEIPMPDAEGRRRLLAVYRGGLDLDLAEPERVIERTEGVTASFIKELLRRAALNAADENGVQPPGPDAASAGSEPDRSESNQAESEGADPGSAADAPRPALRLTDAHLHAALDVLLDNRNRLTRVLLGVQADAPQERRAD